MLCDSSVFITSSACPRRTSMTALSENGGFRRSPSLASANRGSEASTPITRPAGPTARAHTRASEPRPSVASSTESPGPSSHRRTSTSSSCAGVPNRLMRTAAMPGEK